jgi:2-dehydro-3-deoxygluconokinase
LRVVSIGECMIELSGTECSTWRMGFAGDVLNTLWYVKALLGNSVKTDLVSAFGDDLFSIEQIAFLKKNGIGIAASPKIANKAPGLYAIRLDSEGERSFTYWRGEAAARHLADDREILLRSLAGADMVYFSGITLAILAENARETLFESIRATRANGALVAFDPNYRSRLWSGPATARAVIDRACALADIALPAFQDEAALSNVADTKRVAARIAELGPGEIVAKDGGNGALIRINQNIIELPTQIIAPVDTTGAGDSFNGGYLAARLKGLEPESAAEFAHRIASIVIGQPGALVPMADFLEHAKRLQAIPL